MWFSLPHVAEDESEPEEEDKEPRDSGCFESSENLESGREEPKTDEKLQDEAEKDEQQEEKQTEQLDALQEQLQDLTVDEGSWEVMEKHFFYSWFSGTLIRERIGDRNNVMFKYCMNMMVSVSHSLRVLLSKQPSFSLSAEYAV